MLHSLFTLRRRYPHHLLSSLSLTPTTRRPFSTSQNPNTNFHAVSQPAPSPNASLKPHLLELSLAIPETTRTCWRLPAPGPSHVLQLLLALRSRRVTVQKVRSLWEIFKWGARENARFDSKHLPQSREIMASLLVRVGLFKEAEELLFALESDEIFDDLVRGYVGAREWERGVFVYDVMKGRGKVPSRDCYSVLIDLLVKMKRTDFASRVAFDLVDLGVPLSGDEMRALEKVMVLLCIDGKIQEARNMVKKVLALNSDVSSLVFDEIAFGYCERKDFKDLVSFFVEVRCAPSVMVANRVMDSLCRSYGVERAGLFLQELEGFRF
ncbi:Pentatricopeptide repeat-containing protein [Spatholobus suberectus]|nr:Pentatricopeptide repeat-containing protein [Spatholobus suberectus]